MEVENGFYEAVPAHLSDRVHVERGGEARGSDADADAAIGGNCGHVMVEVECCGS